jgi:hypothetical protein
MEGAYFVIPHVNHLFDADHATISFLSSSSNNSIQFFIIYVPSQQPQGQLQTQHSNRYT